MANILLVDEALPAVETLSLAMESRGHAVVRASNGIEGLKKYIEGRFDLVITEVILSDLDGVGLTIEIRSRTPNAKIIAISDGVRARNVEFLRMAGEHGAMATLTKSIQLSEFFNVLSKCLMENTKV